MFNKDKLSKKYRIEKIGEGNIEDIESLPPGKGYDDKNFMAFYDGNTIVAIMDLMLRFPDNR